MLGSKDSVKRISSMKTPCILDRLNTRQTFVQEFEDSLENTDWTYNHTVLKMAANLNSEALMTLGDSRLA